MALDFKRNAVSDIHTTFITKATIVLFCFFLILIVALLVVPERKAAAKDVSTGTYRIISIEVEEGDSLWNIAKEYYTDDFDSIQAYISEIKRMNGISSDTLYTGAYLLVPCYQ